MRVGARRGSRPRGVRRTEYDRCYAMTAVCPATGRAAGLVVPCLDMATVGDFPAEASLRLAPGVHAVLIWDDAGFHTGRSVAVPSHVTLLPLPPNAPERGPVALRPLAPLVAEGLQGLRGIEGGGGGVAGRLPGAGAGPLGLRRALHPPTNLIHGDRMTPNLSWRNSSNWARATWDLPGVRATALRRSRWPGLRRGKRVGRYLRPSMRSMAPGAR